MKLFSRIKTLWVGFWSNLIGETENQGRRHLIEGTFHQYEKDLHKLRNAMTGLIFQRKRLDDKIGKVEAQCAVYQEDLEQAVSEGKDDVSLLIIEKLDTVKSEHIFLVGERDLVTTEITKARKMEGELTQKYREVREKLRTLGSKLVVLEVRKELQEKFNSLSFSADGKNAVQRLEEQVIKVETGLEAHESCASGDEATEKELLRMRQKRRVSKYKKQLDELKGKMAEGLTNQTKMNPVGVITVN